MRLIRLLTLAVLALLPTSAGLVFAGPPVLPQRWVVRHWGSEALDGDVIHALLQARDRYLWVGTNAGLLRYDGSRFVSFNAQNTPELGDGGVSALAESAQGELFIGTTAGRVVCYRDGAFKRTSIAPGTARITALHVGRGGHVWSSTYGSSVTLSKNGTVVSNAMFAAQAVGAILEDPAGGVWIGTRQQGLIHLQGDKPKAHAIPGAVQALLLDHEARLWVGTSDGLLRRSAGGDFERVPDESVAHVNVTSLLEDHEHRLWVGTAGDGVHRLADGRWTSLRRASVALSDSDIRSLLEDHEGNIWVGTAERLNRVSSGTFTTFGPTEGLDKDIVSAVAPGRGGTIWAGTENAHLLRLDAGGLRRFEIPQKERTIDKVITLRELRDGTVWLALDSRRILRFADGRFQDWTPPGDQVTRGVRAFFEDDDGAPLFMVTGVGLARMDRRTREFQAALPHISNVSCIDLNMYPHQVSRDTSGTFWFADLCGLLSYKEGKWSFLDASAGLPTGRVRWVTADADDTRALWVATATGLGYVRDGVVHALRAKDGLPEGYLRLVLDDRHGGLWIASTGNLFRVDKREALDFFAGKVKSVTARPFNNSDGLGTADAILSNNPGFIAEDGRLWFATRKGLAVVDPAQRPRNTRPPAVVVEEITVDDETYDARRAVEAPPGRGDLTFRYSALSYTVAERVRFRYRLEGYDRDWVDAGDRRVAFYTNLRPARYRFRVIACNNDGVWNEQGSSVDVYVAPHFYQTAWFRALAALVAVGAGLLVHNGRVRYLKAREQELARRVDEAVAHISTLRGLLPICASCKKVRDDSGYWNQIELYISDHSAAEFTHSVCPDCLKSLYPEYTEALG